MDGALMVNKDNFWYGWWVGFIGANLGHWILDVIELYK